jgi:hypothetical protein
MTDRGTDPLHPSDTFLSAEIESDRRGERVLITKGFIALAICVAIAIVRQLYFV